EEGIANPRPCALDVVEYWTTIAGRKQPICPVERGDFAGSQMCADFLREPSGDGDNAGRVRFGCTDFIVSGDAMNAECGRRVVEVSPLQPVCFATPHASESHQQYWKPYARLASP